MLHRRYIITELKIIIYNNILCIFSETQKNVSKTKHYLLVWPETIVFWRTYVLLAFILFSPRVIAELRGPIAAKFCTMLGAVFNFIIPVQNFGGASPILADFKVRLRISPERMKTFKIRLRSSVSRFLQRWVIKVRWTMVH